MADIFISYKSERRPAARHLAKVLDAYGYKVWYDYGLVPGDEFEPRLMGELSAAKIVVVIWCAMAVRSEWVNREAGEAKRQGKFLPCQIESVALPAEFAGADTINLTEWDGAPRSHMLDRLLGDIARRLGRDPSVNFNRLRELDEDWRGYGEPTLAHFALGPALTPDAPRPQSGRPAQDVLGTPPQGVSPNMAQHWENAKRGSPAALLEVGYAYHYGRDGLPKDESEAVRLYRLAADHGDGGGQAYLGFMYRAGYGGLPRDEHEAARLFKLAVAQGHAAAQVNLGFMYEEGLGGLPKDAREAVRLYKLSAEQGDANGQAYLGTMYESGLGGLQKDEEEAVRLYTLAAAQGDACGQRRLGVMHQNGRGGLPQDDEEALRLFTLAAAKGDVPAQGYLGFMYANGLGGLPRDDREAVRLWMLAARQGNDFAQEQLKALGQHW